MHIDARLLSTDLESNISALHATIMSSNNEETKTSCVILLSGQDNFNDWLCSINNLLLVKDLSDIVNGSNLMSASMDNRAWRKANRKAFGHINGSVDKIVFSTIPSNLIVYDAVLSISSAQRLLNYLISTYSANTGARQAELYHIMFQTDLAEGKNPALHLAKIKAAYADTVSQGESLSNSVLSFAILLSLPQSYLTLVQSFYLASDKLSNSIISAIRTESRQREMEVKREALSVQLVPAVAPKAKWCKNHKSLTHNTSECKFPPHKAGAPSKLPKGDARLVKVNLDLTSKAKVNLAVNRVSDNLSTTSEGHSFLARLSLHPVVLLARSNTRDYVVDSGATHHMVHDKSLLVDVC